VADWVVIILSSSGLTLTVAGIVAGAVDIHNRIRNYRSREREAAARFGARRLTPIQELFKGEHSFLVAEDIKELQAALRDTEDRLSAAAGLTQNLRGLIVNAGVALTGVLLAGLGDVVAAIHAH
jgi:hypothetical protein